MLLEQLRTNLLNLPFEESLVLFSEYYHKRAEDLQKVIVTPKSTKRKSTKKKDKSVTISERDLLILKKLGLV